MKRFLNSEPSRSARDEESEIRNVGHEASNVNVFEWTWPVCAKTFCSRMMRRLFTQDAQEPYGGRRSRSDTTLFKTYDGMEIIRTVDAMQQFAKDHHQMGKSVALVPTMGALHGGHLSLVDIARQQADTVIVSVFVNPTQFAPDEDFESYPRDLEADAEKLSSRNVDVVFAPTASEMYPHSDDPVRTAPLTWVTVDELDDVLCGRERDQHFRGVTTIVTKLFHACSPDVAVFGQKDAQQLAIIRRMVDELLFDIDIIAGPIVREADGLAMSSRNTYLNEREREQATVLSTAVFEAKARIQAGEQEVQAVVRAMQKALAEAPLGDVEYVRIVDADRLIPLQTLEPGQRVLAAVAVHFGDTRLIDNTTTRVPDAA